MSDYLIGGLIAGLGQSAALLFCLWVGVSMERRRWRALITQAHHENLMGRFCFATLARHWMKGGRFTLFDEAQAETAHRDYQNTVRSTPHDEEERQDVVHLLGLLVRAYGTDAYKTAGKAPVMNADYWAVLERYAEQGLVELDASEAPLVQSAGCTYLGRGFVSLTDAGRAMLPATVTH